MLDPTASPIQRRRRERYPILIEHDESGIAHVHIRYGESSITLKFDRESWAEVSEKIGRNPFWSAEHVAVDSTSTATAPAPVNAQSTNERPRENTVHPDWSRISPAR